MVEYCQLEVKQQLINQSSKKIELLWALTEWYHPPPPNHLPPPLFSCIQIIIWCIKENILILKRKVYAKIMTPKQKFNFNKIPLTENISLEWLMIEGGDHCNKQEFENTPHTGLFWKNISDWHETSICTRTYGMKQYCEVWFYSDVSCKRFRAHKVLWQTDRQTHRKFYDRRTDGKKQSFVMERQMTGWTRQKTIYRPGKGGDITH